MHLARLYIKNYRSIAELDIPFSAGKNVIIGRNNSGKSNIIKAIDLVLGEFSPTYEKGDKLTISDFHSSKQGSNPDNPPQVSNELFIWCELHRKPGEQLNYDEMYKAYGFFVHSKVTEWENKKPKKREPIRVSKALLPKQNAPMFTLNPDDLKDREYVNPKLRHQNTFEQQFENKYRFAFAFRAVRDENDQITKDMRFLYRESDAEDWVLAFKASIRTELLQSAIIPSFRDPQNQLRLTHWTWYGKLMKSLTEQHAKSTELRTAFGQVKKVADDVFSDVKEKVSSAALNVAFPGTELHFQFNADTKFDLYKSCMIYVDDGFKSLLTDKGSGIQSATIIGLFNYYTRYVNTVTSALLCIEEPELYLHPHAQRTISERLDDFLDQGKNQVILSTHSVEFVRATVEDMTVVLVSKDENRTIATPVNIREFKRLLINKNQNELFFADKVVICEGYDDFILRRISDELFPRKLNEQNVSVVSVGGKDNISQLSKVVLKLGIKCFVFADFDYFLRDKQSEVKKYKDRDAKAHESVENLGAEFLSQPCILGTAASTMQARISKIRAELKGASEEKFYLAKNVRAFQHQDLQPCLQELRKNGICILSGEIEECSKDATLLSPTAKLNLDKIYELNQRLFGGTKISDLLELGEIAEFLETVFGR